MSGWVGDLTPTRPLGAPRTFGSCEKQLVCGIQAEDGLGVALGHGDALQWGCSSTLHSSNRGNDAPSQERGREYTRQQGMQQPGLRRNVGEGRAKRDEGLKTETPGPLAEVC